MFVYSFHSFIQWKQIDGRGTKNYHHHQHHHWLEHRDVSIHFSSEPVSQSVSQIMYIAFNLCKFIPKINTKSDRIYTRVNIKYVTKLTFFPPWCDVMWSDCLELCSRRNSSPWEPSCLQSSFYNENLETWTISYMYCYFNIEK